MCYIQPQLSGQEFSSLFNTVTEPWCFLAVQEPLSHLSKINKLLKVHSFCHVLKLFLNVQLCHGSDVVRGLTISVYSIRYSTTQLPLGFSGKWKSPPVPLYLVFVIVQPWLTIQKTPDDLLIYWSSTTPGTSCAYFFFSIHFSRALTVASPALLGQQRTKTVTDKQTRWRNGTSTLPQQLGKRDFRIDGRCFGIKVPLCLIKTVFLILYFKLR